MFAKYTCLKRFFLPLIKDDWGRYAALTSPPAPPHGSNRVKKYIFGQHNLRVMVPKQSDLTNVHAISDQFWKNFFLGQNDFFQHPPLALLFMEETGLHKLWYPGIRDMSTWGKFGAHGEHGDVFLFSNLGAL